MLTSQRAPGSRRAVSAWVLAAAPLLLALAAGGRAAPAASCAAIAGSRRFTPQAAPAARRKTLTLAPLRGDEALARRASAALLFWLGHSPSYRIVRGHADVELSGTAVAGPDNTVRIAVSDSAGHLREDAAGSRDDRDYLAYEVANKIHLRLTRDWLPEVTSLQALRGDDLEFARASRPVDLLQAAGAPSPATTRQPIRIELSVDRGAGGTYVTSDKVRVLVTVDHSCYVTILNIDRTGRVTYLLPNKYNRNNKMPANQLRTVPSDTEPWEIPVKGALGIEKVVAIATFSPLSPVAEKGINVVAKTLGAELKDAVDGLGCVEIRFFTAPTRASE